jgi:hypothetical protein
MQNMRILLYVSLLLTPLILRADSLTLPPEKEMKARVLETLLAFNKAGQDKSFAAFYNEQLASIFRQQMSLDRFTGIFGSFHDKGDIAHIAKTEVVFDAPPAINGQGVLVLKGHYPTQPDKVAFQLKYLNESGAWKLMGIEVRVVPLVENTGPVPSEKESKALALESLLAFNKALQEKSFDSFYTQIAKVWQNQTTPAKLQGIFQAFIDQKADISPIAKVEPVFDQKPAIEDGILVLKGSYPTQPRKVSFELGYSYEEKAWKLVNLYMNPNRSAR